MPKHSSFCLAALVAFSVAPAIAQVQITGETSSAVGVCAVSSTTTEKTLPRGRKVGAGLRVKAVAGDCAAEASATIQGAAAKFAVASHVALNSGGRGSAAIYADSTSKDANATIRFVLRSVTPVAGRLIAKVDFPATGLSLSSLAFSEATIKVGNFPKVSTDNASVPFLTKEFAMTVDAVGTSVEIGIGSLGTAITPITFGASVELLFVPGHQVTAYGGDEWAHLHSHFPDRSTVEFHMWSVFPQSRTFLLIGAQKLNLVLPGAFGPTLLLNPFVVVPGPVTDLTGSAVMRFPRPNLSFGVLAQGYLIEPFFAELMTTNGLDMELIKR